MGIKIPQPLGSAPTAIVFMGISPTELLPPGYPEDVNGSVELEDKGNGLYYGTRRLTNEVLLQVEFVIVGNEFTVILYSDPDPIFLAFSSAGNWPADVCFNELGAGYYYNGGTAAIHRRQKPTIVAELIGAITGPDTYYEPMPGTVTAECYRYARLYNGTRIYVRKDKV